MSLVHDALEKAKREASAKSARELGLPESKVATGQPFRARRQLHGLLVGATLAALAIGALAGFLARSKGGDESAPVARREASPQAPAPAAPPGAPASELQTGASGTSQEVGSPRKTAVTTQPLPPTSPATSESAPEVTTGSTPPAVGAAQVAPIAPLQSEPNGARKAAPATNGSSRTPTYVRQYTLPDGTVVRLGGIAWSDAAPLAYLNGKLYAKGESVEGLRIEAIEKDRVVLASAGGRVVLTLR